MSRTDMIELLHKKSTRFDENDMIVDVQGFHLSTGSFIFKEVSFMAVKKTAIPTVYLFKSPFPLSNLNQSDQNVYKWLEKHYLDFYGTMEMFHMTVYSKFSKFA